jgi:hypothetical protein
MGGKKKTPQHKTPDNKRRRRAAQRTEEDSSDEETSGDENNKEPTNKDVIATIRASQDFLSSKFDELTKTVTQLTLDNVVLKKDVLQLKTTTQQQQQQQITSLSNDLQDVKQQLLQNELVLTGLPDLNNVSIDTIFGKVSEIYGMSNDNIASTQIISGYNKINKKQFSLVFIKMRSTESKRDILNKQKTVGPILWDQLAEDVPDNLKTNKLRFSNRLTQYKQNILIEGKKISKENKEKVPFVWEKNGRILLKENNESRPITLHSLADLDFIKKKYTPQLEIN